MLILFSNNSILHVSVSDKKGSGEEGRAEGGGERLQHRAHSDGVSQSLGGGVV